MYAEDALQAREKCADYWVRPIDELSQTQVRASRHVQLAQEFSDC